MSKKQSVQSSPALSITWQEKTVPITDLKPYERNPRKISKVAFEKLKSSIAENGYHQRIIVQPDLRVIGGHQRIRALQELGIRQITVLVPDHELSENEFRRILVQDNLPFGEFDFDILASDFEKEELLDWGMAPELLDGFEEKGNGGLTDPDECPAEQVVVIARLGDVWRLGQHRVVCGDSTDAYVVESALGGAKPNLMVTDPPYGVEYDASWRTKAGIGSTGAAVGKVLNDDRADWSETWALFTGNVAYVWHGGLHAPTVAQSLFKNGFNLRAQIIWVKTRAALSRGHYHWQHEPAFYAQKPDTDDYWRFGDDHEVAAYSVKDKSTAAWRGNRKQTTVWFIDHIKNDTGHSTQKPVMCMQRPIENNSGKGDGVYDPFLGSGSTLIAATATDRICYGCELNPSYVDVIIRRWQNFTGGEATLEGTNQTFRELEISRTQNT